MKPRFNKLLVVGSKTITDKQWIWNTLNQYNFKILVVNADSKSVYRKQKTKYAVAEWTFLYAREKKYTKIISLVPDWERLSNGNGTYRTSTILNCLEDCMDTSIVLWDGKDTETFDIMQKLRRAKKLYKVFLYHLKTIENFLQKPPSKP